MTTTTVGIRELKIHLSKYLRAVKKGEELIVSERGKEIATILPLRPLSEQTRIEAALLKLSVEGRILLPASLKNLPVLKGRKKTKGSPFSDAIIEGRR